MMHGMVQKWPLTLRYGGHGCRGSGQVNQPGDRFWSPPLIAWFVRGVPAGPIRWPPALMKVMKLIA